MGIYGALATAVTGLKAQSFALENISGNIANSQTVGYKRIETSFVDLIPDGPPSKQNAGSVVANAVATNNVQGDISSSQTATNMAINGTGFFVVQQKSGQSDGNAVFSGSPLYTRRGDFDIDKDGFLVNGAGYYLEGLPVDPTTGNVSGSVPQVIKISNSLLPALPTTTINYQLNLPSQPQDDSYKVAVTGSELMRPGDVLPPIGSTPATLTGSVNLKNDTPATTSGTADISGSLATAGITDGQGLSITIGGVTKTIAFNNTGAVGTADVGVDLTTATGADLVSAINSAFGGTVASLDPTTHALKLTAGNTSDTVAVADDPTATAGAAATLGGLAGAGPTSSVISGLTNALTVQVAPSGSSTPAAVSVNLAGVKDQAGLLAALNSALGTAGTATIDGTTGDLKIVAANNTDTITLAGADAAAVGVTAPANPVPVAA
ncbi:MAG TPA: flagellar hook-basal body complex protein, partial [Devosiaceae bacterium]|nr:flagellar hook-basal body complex protein [Devosiaceae bacterium]